MTFSSMLLLYPTEKGQHHGSTQNIGQPYRNWARKNDTQQPDAGKQTEKFEGHIILLGLDLIAVSIRLTKRCSPALDGEE